MLKQRLNKFIRNPKKALFKLALPVIIGMTVQTLYGVIDTAFVGRIGVDAIAGLVFAFPLFVILFGINNAISVGMSAKISQFIGAKNKTAAENTALHGLIISFLLAIIIFVLGSIFIKPIFILIGAQGNVLNLAMDYMSIILFSVFFMFPAFVFHGIFTSQGDTKTPMILQSTAITLNIILDYIFIFIFHLGVKGVALATVLSFVFNFTLSIYFIRKRSLLQIHPKNFHFSPWIIKNILQIGTPVGLFMLSFSVYFMIMNRFMVYFSNAHVAAFGIIFRLENVIIMPIVGSSIALLTLVGMFYGAKRYDLMKQIIYYALKVSIIFTVIGGAILFAIPQFFLRIFTSDPQVIALGSSFIRVNVFILPLLAIATLINRAMQGLGTGLPGLIINIIRFFVIGAPLSLIFIFVFNYNYLSVALADVIGGTIAAAVALIWITIKLKKLHLSDSNRL